MADAKRRPSDAFVLECSSTALQLVIVLIMHNIRFTTRTTSHTAATFACYIASSPVMSQTWVAPHLKHVRI